MSLSTKVNIKSVVKYANGTFGGQVIAKDDDGNKTFYACRVKRLDAFKVELDRENIYQFVDSHWEKVSVDDAKAMELTYPLRTLIAGYGHLFIKDVSKKKDGSRFGMYSDTVVSLATSLKGHKLKIGDKIFITKDAYSLVGYGQETIEYQIMGDSDSTYRLNIVADKRMADRLNKQLEVAKKNRMRGVNSRPVGGGSWAANQDARKEFGRSRYDHRQLQRSRS